ncbi:MFS transporter [Cellulomonas wangsupingiae]|uniref:MFS transporter n=1 Tax=Cellulomonas wangsupingiae TaxID=2968085 RepID=UPI001D0EF91F|nr:MFS transporter [Cellulomonas wangsupingiae]MCM0638145.1 MFS transporter [Cellulomonas wangsupingiae]
MTTRDDGTTPLAAGRPGPTGASVDVDGLRRRTLAVLAAAQVLGGLAAGSVVSVGSLLAVELSGARAWAGSVTTASTLGAALGSLALARLAVAHGRRRALSTGLALATAGAAGIVLAAVLAFFPLLLVAGALLGVGASVALQSRFAATDLSTPATRSRDLSVVVWASTVGAVVGPNLVKLDEPVARLTGLPALTGVFVFVVAGLLGALVVVQVGLRPDPLDVAGRLSGAPGTRQHVPLRRAVATLRRHPRAAAAVVGVLTAHGVMVAVMSVTSVHLEDHGGSLSAVGVTISLHLGAMFAFAPLMGLLADAVGPRPTLVTGLVVLVLGAAVCGAAGGDHVVVTVGLGLVGLGWSAATVAGSSIVSGDVPPPDRVAVQGLSDAMMSLAGAGGGLLAGVGLQLAGYSGIAATSAVVGLLGAAAVVVVSRRGGREAPTG